MPSPPFCYEYPRPAVTVDLVVFAHRGDMLMALMIKRGRDPFQGSWAIPGGFLDIDEAIEDGARRELLEETGLDLSIPIAFLGVFGAPGRDPRGRTISLAHVAYLPGKPPEVLGGDDASEAAWSPILLDDPAHPLAFDHAEILRKGLEWLGSIGKADQGEILTS